MTDRNGYLTVPQVMAHLQVGRTFVYEQARLFLATGGAEGLPCRRFGRLLRFPLDEIDAYRYPAERSPVVELDSRRATTPSAGRSGPARPSGRRAGSARSSAPTSAS